MDLQFNKTVLPYLRNVLSQAQTQEQTQELRLPDALPDIGRVLGCWGQVLIRGKEWRTDGMSVNGGVLIWVLYAPEDGSAPQSVDTWIPFQMRWVLPQTQRDGAIRVRPYLASVDCRSISARKLMIRAGIGVHADALEPSDTEVFLPDNVPEDVQLLRRTYPIELPQEAGEKPFQLEEELTDGGNQPCIEKIIRYEIFPKISEHKVMAGKLVFRGNCHIHMLYAADDGRINTYEHDISFSQMTDLDRDYGPHATVELDPLVTGMEMERNPDGRMVLKCGMSVQYVIFERCLLEAVEDAYSNQRSVGVQENLLDLTTLLDTVKEDVPLQHTVNGHGQKILDVSVTQGCSTQRIQGNKTEIEIPLYLQVLYVDEAGGVQGVNGRFEGKWCIVSDSDNHICIRTGVRQPRAEFTPDGIGISCDLAVEAGVLSNSGFRSIAGLKLGELQESDPARPSLILCRMGNNGLWELAKQCKSTVDAIRKANQIETEPMEGQMLLIPVS